MTEDDIRRIIREELDRFFSQEVTQLRPTVWSGPMRFDSAIVRETDADAGPNLDRLFDSATGDK